MIPNANILKMAMSVIARQSFVYYAFNGREVNDIGLDIATYLSPQTLYGSIQAVPQNVYQQYGLDFQRNYIMIYIEKDLLDIRRDVSGDKVVFASNEFQCVSKTDWFPIDGWVSMLAVEVVRND